MALLLRRWRWAAFAGLIAISLSDPSSFTGNPSAAYLAEHDKFEYQEYRSGTVRIWKDPVDALHFLAGYWMWKASMVLLAGGGLYGWWRSRREGPAGNIRTIPPEIDHPKPDPARDFDSF